MQLVAFVSVQTRKPGDWAGRSTQTDGMSREVSAEGETGEDVSIAGILPLPVMGQDASGRSGGRQGDWPDWVHEKQASRKLKTTMLGLASGALSCKAWALVLDAHALLDRGGRADSVMPVWCCRSQVRCTGVPVDESVFACSLVSRWWRAERSTLCINRGRPTGGSTALRCPWTGN